MVDQLDLELINALQVSPRGSWARIGEVLGYDASTLSRRWDRLRQERLAWSNCYQGVDVASLRSSATSAVSIELQRAPAAGALVEVDIEAGFREQVIEALSPLPQVLAIDCASGARDLMLTMIHANPAVLDEYISTHVSTIDGIRATRTRYVRSVYKEASQSRLSILSPSQIEVLQLDRGRSTTGSPRPSALLAEIMLSLLSDVRKPSSVVARELGRSVSSVNNAINRLFAAPWFAPKLDFAHDLLGYNAATMMLFRVPPSELDAVGRSLSQVPEVRFCCSLVDRMNLGAIVWLRDFGELDQLCRRIERAFPNAEMTENWLIPRMAKRQGNIIGRDRRFDSFVPYEQIVHSSDG